MTHQKYRPSNGTEGAAFQAEWCERCEWDRAYREGAGEPCDILTRTMVYSEDEEEYPAEWVGSGAADARCTAFIAEGEPLPSRCPHTQDLFGESEMATSDAENQRKTEELMRALAHGINEALVYAAPPEGMSFVLLVFPFGAPGLGNYISNGNRQDIIATLRETADRLEGREDMPAGVGAVS